MNHVDIDNLDGSNGWDPIAAKHTNMLILTQWLLAQLSIVYVKGPRENELGCSS